MFFKALPAWTWMISLMVYKWRLWNGGMSLHEDHSFGGMVVLTKKVFVWREEKEGEKGKRGEFVFDCSFEWVGLSFTSKFGTRHTQKMHMAGTIWLLRYTCWLTYGGTNVITQHGRSPRDLPWDDLILLLLPSNLSSCIPPYHNSIKLDPCAIYFSCPPFSLML